MGIYFSDGVTDILFHKVCRSHNLQLIFLRNVLEAHRLVLLPKIFLITTLTAMKYSILNYKDKNPHFDRPIDK